MSKEASTTHPEYDMYRFIWRSVRDAIDGPSAVKRAHEIYLPMPTGMSIETTSPSITTKSFGGVVKNHFDYSPQALPWYHPNPAYMAYLQRARFPEISSYAVRGLVGVATKESPIANIADSISHLEDRATLDGSSLYEFYSDLLYEVVVTGRVAIVLNVDTKTNLPYLTKYTAESIINWSGDVNEEGEFVLDLVVLEESSTKIKDDGFTHEDHKRQIVFRRESVDEQGNFVEGGEKIVTVSRFEEDKLIDKKVPSIQGNTLSLIPVVIIGPNISSNISPGSVPILGIVEIAYAIYRKDADLSNGEFLTCNPTLFMTGVQPDMKTDPTNTTGAPVLAPDGRADKVLIGSNVILKISNPAAKIGYTQTDTGGLGHVQNRIQALFTEASEYGASMIGPTKKGVESKESLGIKRADTGATLVDIAKSVSKGVVTAMAYCENWMSGAKMSDPGTTEFVAITDFAELGLSARDIHALVTSWMARALSHETLLFNMKEAGFFEDGRTIEEEMAAIESETPLMAHGLEEKEGEYDSNKGTTI